MYSGSTILFLKKAWCQRAGSVNGTMKRYSGCERPTSMAQSVEITNTNTMYQTLFGS